ncbi:lipocalin family protein [Noviherbaspirillum sp.]|uniref:lipocalin family protein n=1 Tax=Noviherbaspirillum sp. TaxID=1926288 RepID=UPI002FE3881E
MNNRLTQFALALAFAACSTWSNAQELKTVPLFDLAKYMGKWHEIARFPNKFQKECASDVTAEYKTREDGQVDVINRCKRVDGGMEEAAGRARIPDQANKAKLEVRFAPEWLSWLPQVWADYWVIDLAPDYSTAAVGAPGRDNLWILSRTPTLSEETYQDIVNRLTAKGFDTAQLLRTGKEKP